MKTTDYALRHTVCPRCEGEGYLATKVPFADALRAARAEAESDTPAVAPEPLARMQPGAAWLADYVGGALANSSEPLFRALGDEFDRRICRLAADRDNAGTYRDAWYAAVNVVAGQSSEEATPPLTARNDGSFQAGVDWFAGRVLYTLRESQMPHEVCRLRMEFDSAIGDYQEPLNADQYADAWRKAVRSVAAAEEEATP